MLFNNAGIMPFDDAAVYSATKAAIHSYALSQCFMLADSGVRVIEISPPWVDTDLVDKSGDSRAMPLPAFVAATMQGLAEGKDEVYIADIQALRDNPGSVGH